MDNGVNRFALSPGARYIIFSTFFFAVMNVGVKYLVRIPAYEIVFFRALVSLIICYLLIRRAGIDPRGNNRKYLLLRGIAGTVALILYFYTLQRMPLASAVTIQYLSPIFTIIIAGFLLKESSRPMQWLFFIVSFAGVVMVKGFDPRVSMPELAIGVVAAVSSGFAYNFIRKLKDSDHPLVVVLYFPLVTVPVVGVYTALHWVSPTLLEWAVLIIIGVAVTAAQVFMTKGYQLERAANISNYNYLGTIYALAIGFFVFDESFGWIALAGIFLILFGVLMSSRFRQADA